MSARRPQARRKGSFKTSFTRAGPTSFEGVAIDLDDLARRPVVEVLLDGWPIRLLHARLFREDLLAAGYGDGCYGFAFTIQEDWLERNRLIEARLANTQEPIGEAILLEAPGGEPARPHGGLVNWVGGLRLRGWVSSPEPSGSDVLIRATIAGEPVAEVRPQEWTQVFDENAQPSLALTFDMFLPERFADGKPHLIHVATSEGIALSGAPLTFLAFPDGLRAFLAGAPDREAEDPRIGILDRLLPMSVPFTSYPRWKEQFPVAAPARPSDASVAVVLVGRHGVDDTLASLERQTHRHWVGAVLEGERSEVEFEPEDLAYVLDNAAADCDMVLFALSGTVFADIALARLADALDRTEAGVVAYPDVEVATPDGLAWPLFFSAFDRERLLEQGYCAHVFAVTREAARRMAGRKPSSLYAAFCALIDEPSEARRRVFHVPGPVARLPVIDLAAATVALAAATSEYLPAGAEVRAEPSPTFLPAVRASRRIPDRRSVSIIIPTRNRADLLKACVDSILAAETSLIREIIVVDNETVDPAVHRYLRTVKRNLVDVMPFSGVFNYSLMNNQAVSRAKGDHICLLNNDTEVVTPDWLKEMLGRLAEPDVAVVGPLLILPNGLIQHAGIVLGPGFTATHALADRQFGDPGYADLLRVAHECSAVTGACLLTRRSDYIETGGLDAAVFPINFNDVDYCLKQQARGKRVIFTPHARLVHHESASRTDPPQGSAERTRLERDLRALRARWPAVLEADPFYSPALTLDRSPFGGLAWPPRSFEPRTASFSEPATMPPGL